MNTLLPENQGVNNQKFENLLNLSLDVSEEEREKSNILQEGYSPATNTWELIVKYHGDITKYASSSIRIEPMIAGYAIVTISEELIDAFAQLEEIEYIEKPKRLIFSVENGKQASCVLQVTARDPYLTGEGTLIGVIDSGIDFYNDIFRKKDGSTKILYLWDQTIEPDTERGESAPAEFALGTEYTVQQINRALQENDRSSAKTVVPSRDSSGHGTAVAGIAADVAIQSELIVVKLGSPNPFSFPKTTELMRGLKYVVDKALFLNRPIAINVSFGNTYGSHDGTSLLERYLDNIAEIGRSVVCVGSGNEGSGRGHSAGVLSPNRVTQIELGIATYETGISVQLWKNYNDIFRITVVSPGGREYRVDTTIPGTIQVTLETTRLLIYVGMPTPYSVDQEIFFDFIPEGIYLDSGIWSFRMEPIEIVTGEYDYYLPSQTILNSDTGFFTPTPAVTITIPATSTKIISVGAYDALQQSYADFSGRGYVEQWNGSIIAGVKPEIVAPGVSVQIRTITGGTSTASGTSFATPFVTGAAALLMEWGVVRGNDPYLYGEKVKSYLIRGARQLPGMESPNPMTGWGALCVRDALPL